MKEEDIHNQCVKWLKYEGYKKVKIINHPTDLRAEKDGTTIYFEVKSTNKDSDYFGAATLTEWTVNIREANLKYLIVRFDKDNNPVDYYIYDAKNFYKYSTVPPFKVNFNIDLLDRNKHTKHPRAIALNDEVLNILHRVYAILKEKNNDKLDKLRLFLENLESNI